MMMDYQIDHEDELRAKRRRNMMKGCLLILGGMGIVGLLVIVLAGWGLITLFSVPEDGRDPDWSRDGSKIVFVSQYDIAVIDIDHETTTRLTEFNDLQVGQPAWSPDGSKIAFIGGESLTAQDTDLYLMDQDGTNITLLIDSDDYIASPTWSPDGTQIVFAQGDCCVAATVLHLYRIDLETTEVTPLAATTTAFGPDWSHANNLIAFGALYDGLYTFDPSSEELTLIVEEDAVVGVDDIKRGPESIDWSPDGSRLAFEAVFDIFVVNADGTGLHRLTATQRHETSPSWSPDGSKIIFQAWIKGAYQLFVMDTDGSNVQQVSHRR